MLLEASLGEGKGSGGSPWRACTEGASLRVVFQIWLARVDAGKEAFWTGTALGSLCFFCFFVFFWTYHDVAKGNELGVYGAWGFLVLHSLTLFAGRTESRQTWLSILVYTCCNAGCVFPNV